MRQEVRNQVRRLQHHPSIAVWSGNNENEAALRQNWYKTEKNFTLYKNDYIKLYLNTIKKLVTEEDPLRIFLMSSPTNGVESEAEGYIAKDPQNERYGDSKLIGKFSGVRTILFVIPVHYYNYAQDGWNKNIFPVPRFSSEYGYQSFPSINTLLKATKNASNLNINSTFIQNRQHHPLGYLQMEWMMTYQLKFPKETSTNYFKTFVFYSQVRLRCFN